MPLQVSVDFQVSRVQADLVVLLALVDSQVNLVLVGILVLVA